MWSYLAEGSAAFALAFLLGTLVEYVVHRLMHFRIVLGKLHARHHAEGWGQGWLREFRDYFLPCLPLACLGFLASLPAGVGWALGVLLYAVLAAYSHQLQHECPDLVFWMRQPVHYTHHHHHMWRKNFGILVDWWDHVLGTYQRVEWQRQKPIRAYGLGAFFSIHWISYVPPEPLAVEAGGNEAETAPLMHHVGEQATVKPQREIP